MERLVVNITKADIESGVKHDRCRCPGVRAIQREFGTRYKWVQITTRFVSVTDTEYRQRFVYHPSQALMNFIKKFDNGEDVKPGRFVVHLDYTKPMTSHNDNAADKERQRQLLEDRKRKTALDPKREEKRQAKRKKSRTNGTVEI